MPQLGVEFGEAGRRAHIDPAAVVAGAGDVAGGHRGRAAAEQVWRAGRGRRRRTGPGVGAEAGEGEALAAAVVAHAAVRQQAEVAGRVVGGVGHQQQVGEGGRSPTVAKRSAYSPASGSNDSAGGVGSSSALSASPSQFGWNTTR